MLVATAGPAAAAPARSGERAAPVAVVETGALHGSSADGVDSFLGVPFARPPVGALRWRPPQRPTGWTGVRDATVPGNVCPQPGNRDQGRSETEDCLYLNVQRPAGPTPPHRLPVYVYLHGGGFTSGSGSHVDGSLLARQAGVLVVTVNYRLGVFGFLAHPALTAEAGQSGDYGFMDQQAALAWVHRNIAAFGGDPRRVTLGGESAGGFAVCAHLSAPGSRGLFARAVIESGSCPSQTLPAAEATGSALAAAVGCAVPATAVACLRAAGTATLLDATTSPPASLVAGVPVLPQPPADAAMNGTFSHVPLLIGANRDEGRFFARDYIGGTRQQYENAIVSGYPVIADQLLARYPWPDDADRFAAAYLGGAIITDSGAVAGIGGCPARRLTNALAGHTTTYAYEFDHRTGPGPYPDPVGYVWGAAHAGELAYLFPSEVRSRFTATEQRLSAEMVRLWGAFIRTGRPAPPSSWPADPPRRGTLALRPDGASTLIPDATLAAEHQCDLWDAGS